MKGPSLQKTAALSAALHATIFILTIIVLKNSSRMVMPSPYVVNLVSPGEVSSVPSGGREAVTEPEHEIETTRAVEKAPAETKIDERRIEDRIAAIKAIKKLERNERLRRAILSVKGGSDQNAARAKATGRKGTRGAAGGGEATYGDLIRSEIHKQWSYPDPTDRNLEAIISVRIMKDGEVKVQEIEKSSGKRLFDKLALKAIELASPVTPPPYEMEFGIRFTP